MPDLRSFDADKYSAIVLDEFSRKQAVVLKKLLQASSEPVVLGVSPTMVSSHTVHVWRTRIIVSTNLWNHGMRRLPKVDSSWLRKNSVYVAVQSPPVDGWHRRLILLRLQP